MGSTLIPPALACLGEWPGIGLPLGRIIARRWRERRRVKDPSYGEFRLAVRLMVGPPSLVIRNVLRQRAPFEKLADGLIRFIAEEFAAVGHPAEHVIKAGDHQDADDCAHEHAADARGADGSVADGSGAC